MNDMTTPIYPQLTASRKDPEASRLVNAFITRFPLGGRVEISYHRFDEWLDQHGLLHGYQHLVLRRHEVRGIINRIVCGKKWREAGRPAFNIEVQSHGNSFVVEPLEYHYEKAARRSPEKLLRLAERECAKLMFLRTGIDTSGLGEKRMAKLMQAPPLDLLKLPADLLVDMVHLERFPLRVRRVIANMTDEYFEDRDAVHARLAMANPAAAAALADQSEDDEDDEGEEDINDLI